MGAVSKHVHNGFIPKHNKKVGGVGDKAITICIICTISYMYSIISVMNYMYSTSTSIDRLR